MANTRIPTVGDICIGTDGQFMDRNVYYHNRRPFDVERVIAEGTSEWFDFIVEHKLYN